MISTISRASHNNQTTPHLHMNEARDPSHPSLPSVMLGASFQDVGYDHYQAPDASTSEHPHPGMPVRHHSASASTTHLDASPPDTQFTRASSLAPSMLPRRPESKGGNWRKRYADLIDNTPNVDASPGSSLGHSSADSADSAMSTDVNMSTTGCYISAPLSPPVGYPMPQSQPPMIQRMEETPADPRDSVISSSSSGSSKPPSITNVNCPVTPNAMPPPQWAQPPKKPGPRATSFDSGLERPSLYNPEQQRGASGEPVEVLRGEQGRIAIKSTPAQYEVLVWLPGFSINDITIVTRKGHVLKIVADQWDENDHAQWEIRLGEDAVMSTVRATFTGEELKITVARSNRISSSKVSIRSDVSMRTASSRQAPSMNGTLGHHERSFSQPTASWTDTDRRDLEHHRGADY